MLVIQWPQRASPPPPAWAYGAVLALQLTPERLTRFSLAIGGTWDVTPRLEGDWGLTPRIQGTWSVEVIDRDRI